MKKIIRFLSCTIFIALFISNSYAQTKYLYTVAGGGASFCSGCPATSCSSGGSKSIATDIMGNIYYGGYATNYIMKVNVSTGYISIFAGNPIAGSLSSNTFGDGTPAVDVGIKTDAGVYVDASNNLYYCDIMNNVIRKVDGCTGIISLFAGRTLDMGGSDSNGTLAINADLGGPWGITSDASGNFYIADWAVIRKVNTLGKVYTFAGTGTSGYSGDGGPALAANINNVGGMAFDAMGNLYFVDQGNNVVRKIDAGTNIIHTIAGGGTTLGDGGPATSANLSGPQSIAIDIFNNLIIGDNGHHRIRMVSANTGIINTVAGGGSNPANDGTAALSDSIFFGPLSLDRIGNLYYISTDGSVKKITNFNPTIGTGSVIASDSFSVDIDKLCGGSKLIVNTPNYVTGRSIKTYFGDGTTDSSAILGDMLGGFVTISHAYSVTGNYTVRQILYSGALIQDSISFAYIYTFCRTLPVDFYYDFNGDCIKEATESFALIPTTTIVDSNGIPVDTLSATSGFSYDAYGSPDDIYSFSQIPSEEYIATCPVSGIIYDTLLNSVNEYPVKYVAVSCSASSEFDLAVNASLICGRHKGYGYIFVSNNYCDTENATVTMGINPKYTIGGSTPPPTSILDNIITWDESSLSSETPMSIISFSLDLPLDSPYHLVGDTVQWNVMVTPTIGDANIVNNYCIFINTVVGSYDPNEMSVSPNGCLQSLDSVHQLTYSINFQNTGNDTAFNIFILDTLSDAINPHSLRIVAASAVMNTSITNSGGFNIVQFSFPNINLLDTLYPGLCNGMVVFKVNTIPDIGDSASIFNEAGIYFDSNAVVMTNQVENTVGCASPINQLQTPIYHLPESHNNVSIFPNPTTSQLTIIMSPFAYSSFTITNNLGQNMIQQPLSATQTQVNVAPLPPGMYYVTFRGDNGTTVQKFVKM